MKRTATMLAALLLAAPAWAQSGTGEGEVRRIDKEAGKLTIRHGPIAGELSMTAMTMVFRPQDPALLDRLQVGDRIAFEVVKQGGAYVITRATPK